MNQLTSMYNFELEIEMTGYDGKTYTANYNQFRVGPKEESYPLHVQGYSGDAGDMFNYIQSNGWVDVP